jgi:CubicO group peptidase (beta-lactamase class C family)
VAERIEMKQAPRFTTSSIRSVVGAVAMLLTINATYAQSVAAASASEMSEDARRVIEYVEKTVGPWIESGKAPGAVLSVVDRDRVYLRAWGNADIAAGTPMDAKTTRVRVGSITKSFTALSALQLVDEKKLLLDMPANQALRGAKLQVRGPHQTTVKDLLTHRAGLDGDMSVFDVGLNRPFETPPGWLSKQLLSASESGTIFAYDNAAYAALGQIVADMDNTSLAVAMKARIFDAVGMPSTSLGFSQSDENKVAACYLRTNGKLVPCVRQKLRMGAQAAGDLTTTAEDMATFMQALLRGGVAKSGKPIVSAGTFSAFSSAVHRIHPLGAGIGLGAYGAGDARSAVYGHSGGISGGSSMYFIAPKQGVGVFVHFNVASSAFDFRFAPSALVAAALEKRVDDDGADSGDLTAYLMPYQVAALLNGNLPPPKSAADDPNCNIASVPGRYAYVRAHGFSAFNGRFLSRLLVQPEVFAISETGDLTIGSTAYKRVTPCYYISKSAPSATSAMDAEMAFMRLADGRHMAGSHPLLGLIQLRWYETPAITVFPLLGSLIFLIFFAGLQALRLSPSHDYRLACRALLAGALIYVLCLLAEMEWAVPVTRDSAFAWLAWIWRSGLAFAIALIGLATFYLVRAARNMNGWYRAIAALLALASCVVMALSVYWFIG